MSFLAILKLVPTWVWVALGLLGAAMFYGHLRFNAGQAETQAKWDESIARGKQDIERLRIMANSVSVRVEREYIDRVKIVREKGDAIVREAPVFVPADSCALLGGFRLLHDAAATGNDLPSSAAIADAAPVTAQAVATTVAENYGECRVTQARLVSLQEWVYRQCMNNPPKEGCGDEPPKITDSLISDMPIIR